jgi:REP element-mobilizing transposase RayT
VIYLITFVCYGRHLHGSESGSVDRLHNAHRTPTLDVDAARVAAELERMDQVSYDLDEIRRDAVLKAIQDVCAHNDWNLLAAHVRTSHVHAVVVAEVALERVMNAFKAYASRRLNDRRVDAEGRKRRARHGSTRHLWKPEQLSAASQYVVNEQGDPMSIFESKEF